MRVSDTIMGSLLTPEELHKLAEKLLETKRVQEAILWLLKLTLQQIKKTKQEKAAKILANILKDLFGESLPRLLKVLARKDGFLQTQIDQIFDQILVDFQLTESQAKGISNWLLEVVLSPDLIRKTLIQFLTDRNIQVIDEGFREKTSGADWFVANLFGLTNTLIRLRTFCLDEKEMANLRIKELLLSLEIRNRLREILQNLSLQNLPPDTITQLRNTTNKIVYDYLQDKGISFLQEVGLSLDWDKISSLIIKRLKSSTVVNSSLSTISDELALILEHYLEKDLEKIVAQAIPLAIDKVIIERINSTSPEELENAVQAIVKTELQAIVNLGGFLGLMIGVFQSFIFIFGN